MTISCIVEKALESLTRSLGMGTKFVKFSNTDDKNRTIKLFEMLLDEGEIFNPDEIGEWVVKNPKWGEKEVNKLLEIVETILVVRNRGYSDYWRDDLIEDFRKKCNN